MVNPGTYLESVESPSAMDFSASTSDRLEVDGPGEAIIRPPAGTNGFFISHSFHTIDGFKVAWRPFRASGSASTTAGGQVVGLLIQNNRINNNSNTGISVTSGLDIEIAFNVVKNNGHNGISYSGSSSLDP